MHKIMKNYAIGLCALLAAVFALPVSAQEVKPKGKKVTELKLSGRIQAQWDHIESDETDADRNHFYFRRLFFGGHAKLGGNWGGDVVLDFAASPNSEGSGKADQVFIDGASAWYKVNHFIRLDFGQLKVPFGMEETSSSSKIKAIERSAMNRQFAERLKFHARHMGIFAKGNLGKSGFSYNAAIVNAGQNHSSKDSALKKGLYGYKRNEFAYFGRIAYSNYDAELRHVFGLAAGVQPNAEYKGLNSTVDVDKTTAFNFFAQLGYGTFNLDTEYMFGEADVTGGNHKHNGYAVQASYTFNNAPKGVWEFVYRYSAVDGTGANDLVSTKEIIRRANISSKFNEANELDQHYFGVNYQFQGHDAKLMLGYESNKATDTTHGSRNFSGFRTRVQVLF